MDSLKALNDTLAGSAAGIAQVLVGQPLDTIKTRAQIAPSMTCWDYFFRYKRLILLCYHFQRACS